jgi:hypothetical protein
MISMACEWQRQFDASSRRAAAKSRLSAGSSGRLRWVEVSTVMWGAQGMPASPSPIREQTLHSISTFDETASADLGRIEVPES